MAAQIIRVGAQNRGVVGSALQGLSEQVGGLGGLACGFQLPHFAREIALSRVLRLRSSNLGVPQEAAARPTQPKRPENH